MNKQLEAVRAWLLELKRTILVESKKKDNLVIFLAVFSALIVMLAVTAALLLKPASYDGEALGDDGAVEIDVTQELRHPLTGAVLDAPLESRPQVFGVMVENSADAWPLSGIEDAYLVIEAPVEGGIPRFITFFATDMEVAKIGPVRSARPYYLDWNDELGGLYAHVGGSPEGLDLIRQFGTADLNEFFQGEYFWRDTARRAAPHNVYTSTELLTESLEEFDLEVPDYDSWLFKVDAPLDVDALSLTVDWGSGDLYDVKWAYEPESNRYLRMQGVDVVNSQDGDPVLANNVIVMAADITVVDSVTRRHIQTTGEGDALVVQDGRIILGRWKKSTRTDRLRFYDAAGQEIKMNAGKTWIEVVPSLDRAATVKDLQ
jgi:hypothetical protein